MKKIAIVLLSFLLVFLPTTVFAQKRVPILVYHSIDEFKGHGDKELYVTPENFSKQMTYLRDHGYTLLTFERWKDVDQVKKPIFVTFDDGYKNQIDALAVFKKLQTERFKPTGTIFVISDFIGGANRLTALDLKMLANSGMFSIQSHSATHLDLTKSEKLEYQLKESKEKIQQITGKPVIALSYPYGNFNPHVVAETKKLYQFGLTTTPGVFIQKGNKDEKFLLPRIYVKNSTTLNDFAKIVK